MYYPLQILLTFYSGNCNIQVVLYAKEKLFLNLFEIIFQNAIYIYRFYYR